MNQELFFVLLFIGFPTFIYAETCRSYLTETIPKDLVFNQTIDSKDTHDQFLKLINSAKYSIDIASFYWTLLGKDVMPENPVPESKKGEDVLNALINVAKTKSIKIRIAVNDDKNSRNNQDLNLLEAITEIRRINFTRLVGAGILHTKFILVDNQSFYLGSTNMDWRSLTHVKELGITSYDCSPIAQDLANIFSVYWYLGVNTYVTIPDHWPNEYSVNYNLSNQQEVQLNTETYKVYLSSSPKELCPDGRTNDIDSILSIINSAEKYIYIAVMDYFPIFLYKRPTSYWPTIDDALRRAAVERKVQIRLLASHWNHTRPSMKIFLKSLEAFVNDRDISGSIETRLFQVPTLTPEEKNIPFARVNHNKYMVTDKVAYIGTSNWSADYFVSTGGVGLALTPTINHKTSINLHEQIRKIFERDWNSKYSQTV